MGAARDHEDTDEGHGHLPKLIMAGRLTGTLDGRPVVIDANDAGLSLAIASVRAAWAARRSMRALLPLLGAVKRAGIPVRMTIAGFMTLELLPKPSALIRMFAPSLSSLT